MTHMGSTNSKKKKNNKLTYNQDPSNIYIYIYIYIYKNMLSIKINYLRFFQIIAKVKNK